MSTLLFMAAAVVLAVGSVGCRKAARPTTSAVTADAAPRVIETAFQTAEASVKADAASAAAATSNQDPAALSALTRMLQRPELSPEQRVALGRCLPAALTAARTAAERGDSKAAETLRAYNAGK